MASAARQLQLLGKFQGTAGSLCQRLVSTSEATQPNDLRAPERVERFFFTVKLIPVVAMWASSWLESDYEARWWTAGKKNTVTTEKKIMVTMENFGGNSGKKNKTTKSIRGNLYLLLKSIRGNPAATLKSIRGNLYLLLKSIRGSSEKHTRQLVFATKKHKKHTRQLVFATKSIRGNPEKHTRQLVFAT